MSPYRSGEVPAKEVVERLVGGLVLHNGARCTCTPPGFLWRYFGWKQVGPDQTKEIIEHVRRLWSATGGSERRR